MAYSNPSITNALGKPVVEQKQDFFVLFEGAFSTAPEIIDQTSYKITYVVDGQGNISKPAELQPFRLMYYKILKMIKMLQ